MCVLAMHGYNDEPVETKLGMVIEGPKVEVTEAHATCSTLTTRVHFNWNYEAHACTAHRRLGLRVRF